MSAVSRLASIAESVCRQLRRSKSSNPACAGASAATGMESTTRTGDLGGVPDSRLHVIEAYEVRPTLFRRRRYESRTRVPGDES